MSPPASWFRAEARDPKAERPVALVRSAPSYDPDDPWADPGAAYMLTLDEAELDAMVEPVRTSGLGITGTRATDETLDGLFRANTDAHPWSRKAFEAVASHGPEGMPIERRTGSKIRALNEEHARALSHLVALDLVRMVPRPDGRRYALTDKGRTARERYLGAADVLERAAENRARAQRTPATANPDGENARWRAFRQITGATGDATDRALTARYMAWISAQTRAALRAGDGRTGTPADRGTPAWPCEACGGSERGNTRWEGWYRCNACGHPSP